MVWSLVDKDAKANDDGLRPLMALDLSSQLDPNPDEGRNDYFNRALDSRTPKTSRFSEPALPRLFVQRAIAAYNFLMRFETDTEVNLLDELPSLGNIVNDEGPAFLRNIFRAMNESMKEAFREMKKIPAGVHFVPGVAGCGKSFMLENINLFSQFGSCPAHVLAKDARPRNLKTLYLLDNNAGVEAFTSRLTNRYKDLEIKYAPRAMDSEIACGMKKKAENEDAAGHLYAMRASLNTEWKSADHGLAEGQQAITDQFEKLRRLAGAQSNNDNEETGDAQVKTDTGGSAWNDLPTQQEPVDW
ncbi:hypothetical protein FDECE_2041 [Fusarium decemcellulare]|nr:hypothetical protein FDECE_2041 [Fusarium decemcellulare]